MQSKSRQKRDDSFVKYKILKRQKPFPIKEKGVCLQSGFLFEADCQLFSVSQQDFGLRPFDFGDFALNRKRIDRLTAVKATAQEFLEKRADDRIGLILFGTNAYLQAPLTFDKKSVSDILWQMSAGMAGESTAIGDALGLALKTIKDAPNPDKKIVILLTDGENNDGRLSLPQAIKLAQDEGVKIYTIGVGSDNAFMGSFMGIPLMGGGGQLDEASLKEIARLTEGRYFRAKDTAGLQKIYGEIDKLEPDDNEERYIREIRELFYIPLLAALASALILAFGGRRRYHG